MPNETSIQLLLRLPIKKESLLLLRLVYHATPSNNRKYAITNENKKVADMLYILFFICYIIIIFLMRQTLALMASLLRRTLQGSEYYASFANGQSTHCYVLPSCS